MPLPKGNKKYTYADYLTWAKDEIWEILDGIPLMQAALNWQHQAISRELILQFGNYLQDKTCQVFAAPFDLRLSDENENDEDCIHVYQPDLVVICDKNRLKGTGYHGVPDLVIEIVSPSTARNDKLLKFNMYEKVGVKEYWIVEPDSRLLSVFTLQDSHRYGRPEVYAENDNVEVSIFNDLTIKLDRVFAY